MADTDKIYNSIAAEKARAQYVKNLMGAADGIATLDSSGLVPSDQLPSYIDDIVELVNITDSAPSTCSKGDWYFNTTTSKLYKATAANTWGVTAYNPEKAKIYFNKTDEKSYRWGGSAMVEVSTSDIIGIKVGSSGSTITPSQGVIELPAYEAGAQVNPGVMGASGSTHASGLVPDTPDTAGTAKFLREDGTWQTPEGGATYVPTLNSAPTSSTTTYTKDGQTVDFEIGQFARVADAEAEEGYVFYQLYDLTTEGNVTTAKWKEANTGGGDATGRIKVSIAAYVNDIAASASLIGNVIVTLTNTTDSGTPVTATWNGSDITFKSLTPLKNYRVAIEDKTGWLRNKEYEDITNLGISEEKSVSFSYSADEYSCSVSGTADGRIVVSGTEYANGQTFRVAKGTSISATAKAVANYVTPTPSVSGKAISAVYVAYGLLTVVTSSNQDEQGAPDATIAAVSPTVKIGDGAAVIYSSPMPIAPDASVEVEWPSVTGYTAPTKQTFTMPSTDTTKSGGYATTILTVMLASDTGEADLSGVTKTVTDTTDSTTVTPQQDGTYKIPTGHSYSVSVSDDVEGYKAPDAATGTAAGTIATVTMTYEEQAGFVDLGLPSGKVWASGNLVKDSQGNYSIGEETDWGIYASWGNIVGHNEGEGYSFDQTTYDSTPGHSVAANIPSNDAAHDIALATLGMPWHLPTKEDLQELYDNTDSEWVADYNGTGVAGRKFMKKSDHSVYVFFPAAGSYSTSIVNRGYRGYCWASSYRSSSAAYYFSFDSSGVYPSSSYSRYYGFSVRPVQYLSSRITFRLSSTDGSSVSGLTIEVTDKTGTHTLTTDANGEATAVLANGTCTISSGTHDLNVSQFTVVAGTTVDITATEKPMTTGYIILDQTSSDPTTKVIDESGNTYSSYQRPAVITAIRQMSHCYVGTFANNKMTLKQLSDSDGTQYADGTSAATDITGSTGGNVFMRLPYFFTRVSEYATDKIKIEFAIDEQQTATTTRTPSGNGWKQWGGNDLIGKYEACSTSTAGGTTAETADGTSGYLRSRSTGADSLASVSQANFKQKARNNGTGFTLVKWRHQNIMAILFYAYYGHTNCQSLIGSGASAYSGSTRYIGLKNSLGMTDTTSANGNTDNTVFWGLENWWGCKYEWVDNVVVDSGTWTITEDDGSTRTLTAGTHVMTAAGSTVYPSKFYLGDDLDTVGAVGQTGGSDSTGYCDGQYIKNDSSRVVARSGGSAYADGGVAFVSAYYDSSGAGANFGSRLAFTGTIEIS